VPIRMLLLCPGRVSIHEVRGVGIELGVAVSHATLNILRKLWKRQVVGDVVIFFPSVDAPTKDKDEKKLIGSPPIDADRRSNVMQASVSICAIVLQKRGVRKHAREELRLSVLHADLR